MKKIIEYLEKNGIEYRSVTCGNPYYYNDGFTVPAISIRFDYESIDCSSIPEMQKTERAFLKSMERRKNHCIGSSGKSGIYIPWYIIFKTEDFKRYQEHEARIRADVEKFWKEEHTRREREMLQAVM